MAVLEFVMILMAIIVGLGIAEILRCFSRVLLQSIKPGRIHAIWMGAVFLLLIEAVIAAWGFRDRADWTFLQILALLAPPALLYVAATVLNAVPSGGQADEFFMERRRPFSGRDDGPLQCPRLESDLRLAGIRVGAKPRARIIPSLVRSFSGFDLPEIPPRGLDHLSAAPHLVRGSIHSQSLQRTNCCRVVNRFGPQIGQVVTGRFTPSSPRSTG